MNKTTLLLFFGLMLTTITLPAQDQRLALTPPMGWNSWNFFEGEVSAGLLNGIADAMVSNGMKDAGYDYIIIDDYWVGGRDAQNQLFPDPVRFPEGMKALADDIHAKGMKLGIYSNAAELTCGGVTGSLNYEELDAKTFASWGIDYLKYDYCNAPEDVITAFKRYHKMSEALKSCGRPVVFAVCEWGQRKPWLWAQAAGGQLWRTTYDSRDTWETKDKFNMGILDIFDLNEPLGQYAGPGAWNDPDLLMVGLNGKGKSSSGNGKFKGCTPVEYRTHFALWAMMAAPLIVNSDVRKLDAPTAEIILNKDIIAIDQDPLGRPARTIYRQEELQVLQRELKGGDIALCIFNRADNDIVFNLNLLRDLKIGLPYSGYDIFGKKEIPSVTALKGPLKAHDCAIFRLRPRKK